MVLGVLVILTVLGVAFASLQQLERAVARNYVDDVRAKLVASSGIEHGVARLSQMLQLGTAGFDSPSWRYYGNDLAESGDPDFLLEQEVLAARSALQSPDESGRGNTGNRPNG